jgi:hypothetical protein
MQTKVVNVLEAGEFFRGCGEACVYARLWWAFYAAVRSAWATGYLSRAVDMAILCGFGGEIFSMGVVVFTA